MSKGPYNPEDFITVHKKAQAIVSCYLDSVTSPRVQININNDVARDIMDKLSKGNITHGLFHKAVLEIFSGLMYYWKKYTAEKYVTNLLKYEILSHTIACKSRCNGLFPLCTSQLKSTTPATIARSLHSSLRK